MGLKETNKARYDAVEGALDQEDALAAVCRRYLTKVDEDALAPRRERTATGPDMTNTTAFRLGVVKAALVAVDAERVSLIPDVDQPRFCEIVRKADPSAADYLGEGDNTTVRPKKFKDHPTGAGL